MRNILEWSWTRVITRKMSIQQSVCRVCLDGNVTMYCINTELRDLYEILALTKVRIHTIFYSEWRSFLQSKKISYVPTHFIFQLDGRPKTLCYICYSQLKRCCQFAKLCKESEQILITLVNSGYEVCIPHKCIPYWIKVLVL